MAIYDYNIEPALEAALISIFNGANLTARGAFDPEPLVTPSVTVEFVLGAERPSTTPRAGFENVRNLWEGQFVVTVYTDRDRNGQSHSAYRSTVRQIIAETPAQQWEAAVGSNFRILSMDHLSTTPATFDTEKAIDSSTMNYTAAIALVPIS